MIRNDGQSHGNLAIDRHYFFWTYKNFCGICLCCKKGVQQMFEFLIKQKKVSEAVTEELKEQKQWEWVQILSNIQQQAKEIARLHALLESNQSAPTQN